MEEVGHKETEARLLNVERAQAYALMGIAESLKGIRNALEKRS